VNETGGCLLVPEPLAGRAVSRSPAPPHWLVIANPAAGRSGPQTRAWNRIEQALRERRLDHDVAWTAGPGDGSRIAAAAWRQGRTHFLVAGGDGSVHDVINGLMRERADDPLERGPPTVVPLPLGTGNDWSRSLGLPRQAPALASVIQRNDGVLHDLGRIDLLDANGTPQDRRWFVNIAGAGFDAHVIERMPARTPSRLAYLWGALRELARYQSPVFRLTFDRSSAGGATTALAGHWLLLFAANGRYCGGGMHVAPSARPDDGLLDLVTIEAVGLLRALPKLARLYRGNLLQDALVRHHKVAQVRIDADPRVGVEADGQYVGRTPAVITTAPRALRTLRSP
jgi:diacylglycerol kinase (ATP)